MWSTVNKLMRRKHGLPRIRGDFWCSASGDSLTFGPAFPRTWAGLPVTGLKRVKNLFFLSSSLLAIGGLLLGFKRRVRSVWLFAALLLSYPLSYYITCTEPRYRHAIEPELVILAVFLILSLSAPLIGRSTGHLSGTRQAKE